jgi:RimJ/RimL family protein N-acetyltransferase
MTIKYVFSNLGIKKLVAYVFPENVASIRVLEKNGMISTGEISEYHILSRKYKKSLVFKMNKS